MVHSLIKDVLNVYNDPGPGQSSNWGQSSIMQESTRNWGEQCRVLGTRDWQEESIRLRFKAGLYPKEATWMRGWCCSWIAYRKFLRNLQFNPLSHPEPAAHCTAGLDPQPPSTDEKNTLKGLAFEGLRPILEICCWVTNHPKFMM